MKPASPELLALLATRQFYVADLYTFAGGNLGSNVLRFCGGDQDVSANGFTYSAGAQTGPYFDRQDNKAKCHWKVGVEVNTLVFDVLPGSSELFGAPFQQAVVYGLFDGAELTLERAYMPTYGDTAAGTVVYFVGRVAAIDAGRSVCTFSVNSHLELLNLQLPRNLFQAGCVNNLGDAACGVNLEDFVTTGTVGSGSTNGVINASISGSFGAGTFDNGKILFTSGVLEGLSQTVKSCAFGSPDVITLLGYFPTAPSSGDSFKLYYGCDKSNDVTVSFTASTGAAVGDTGLYGISNGNVPVGALVSGPQVQSGSTVAEVEGSTVYLDLPTLTPEVYSQSYTAALTSANGCPKFSNQARYKGFPLVPQPVTAI